MTILTRDAIALIMLIALSFSGCSDSEECTLIGCENGVVLTFEGADGRAITAFKGSVTAGAQVTTVECGPGAEVPSTNYLCHQNELFLRVSNLEEVALNIHATDSDNLAFIGAVGLNFEPQYPNGEACAAACERAEATVVMVETQAVAN